MFTDIWVSSLALVIRSHWNDGVLEGFVLEGNSGEPVAGAEVQAWSWMYNTNTYKVETTRSDQNGLFHFQGISQAGSYILAQGQGQELATAQLYASYSAPPVPLQVQTVFFTDRSLYRWCWDYNTTTYKVETARSDQNGLFRFQGIGNATCYLLAQTQGQEIATSQPYGVSRGQPRPPHEQTVFFTDRSLYRPGQTIQFKGICIAVDQEQNNYKTVPNRTLTVLFSDPNGKEIARLQQKD